MRVSFLVLTTALLLMPAAAPIRAALAEEAESTAPSSVVVGVVREGGKPVAATVTLRRTLGMEDLLSPDPDSLWLPAQRVGGLLFTVGGLELPPAEPAEPRSVKTDGEGRFRFEGLAHGGYRLEARTAAGGFGAASHAVRVDGTVLACDLEIGTPKRRTVSGRARFRDGRPFRGHIAPVDVGMVTTIPSRGTRTDVDGRFRLTVEEGDVPGHWPSIGAIVPRRDTVTWALPKDDTPLELVVDEEVRELRGVVVGARTGKPIKGAWVFAMSTDNKRPHAVHYAHVRTDANGRFRMPQAPASARGVVAVGPRHGHAMIEFGDTWPSSLRMPLKLGARVHGSLLRAGVPRPVRDDVDVRAWLAATETWPTFTFAEVKPDGSYDFGRLPPGRTLVFAVGRDVVSAGLAEYVLGREGRLAWGTTKPAGDLRLDLSLVPCGQVAGVVVDATGKPIAGALARAHIAHDGGVTIHGRPPDAEDNRFQRGASAADGSFSLGCLIPGVPYTVTVQRAGYADAESEVLRAVSGQIDRVKIVLQATSDATSPR